MEAEHLTSIIKTEDNSHEVEADLYSSTPFLPKLTYSMDGETITAFDFVNLKALGRSPAGHYSTSFLAIALESGLVRIYDTFLERSLIFEFAVPLTADSHIVQVASSTISDDMQLSILTSNGLLYIYDVSLERRFKLSQPNQQREL